MQPNKVTISIQTTIGFIASAIGAAIIYTALIRPDWRNDVEFIAKTIGGITALYTAYFIGINIKYQYEQNKLKATFEFLHRTKEFSTTKIIHFLEKEIDGSAMGANEMYTQLINDSDAFSNVNQLLGYFEDLSIAVQLDYVDEPTVYKSMAFLADFSNKKLKPYIEEERRVNDEKTLYIEFQKLCDTWSQGRYLYSNKKIDPMNI